MSKTGFNVLLDLDGTLTDSEQGILRSMRHALQMMNRPSQDDVALRKLSDEWGHSAAYQIAMLHAVRDEVDAAFEWLERAYAQRDPGVVNISSDSPFANSLRADPRWLPFLQKMKMA